MKYAKTYLSPLGKILLASDGERLTGLWFEGQKYFPREEFEYSAAPPVFSEAERWLDIYFSGREPCFTPPLKLTGTDFQLEVWELLRCIPYGRTVTYGELAARVAESRGLPRMSAQAVGGAVGRNNISIIVPCHRVVGADGSLTGYAGGADKKARLLALEGIDVTF